MKRLTAVLIQERRNVMKRITAVLILGLASLLPTARPWPKLRRQPPARSWMRKR